MATSSEVKAGLDNIAQTIRDSRSTMNSAKAKAQSASTELAELATTYADVVNTINAYPSNTTDAFEQVAKAELAKMVTEFTALKSAADAVAATDLG